jgi:hypothetical protein
VGPHLSARAGEVLSRRFLGDGERAGDLGVRVALEVVQQDHLTLAGGKGCERAEDELAIGPIDGLGRIGGPLTLARESIPKTVAHEGAPAAVAGDGEEPRVETLGLAASVDVLEGLGAEGYALTVVDRTLAGLAPTALDAVWPLNMVPFGVAIDGAIIDPSGPWYDGGPADPNNPFDRACSGWEYDPIFPAVADLVGVSSQVRGHVQPGPGGRPASAGLFHYHGTPAVMLENLRGTLTEDERRQALVVGYSADGFWILDAVVPAPATVSGKQLHLFSGYVLRQGARATMPHTNPALVPAGTYDGTFVQDWRFDPEEKRLLIESALRERGEYDGLARTEIEAERAEFAVLDERNGFVTDRILLRDAPARTYVYVLTPDMPQLPRWFAFEPSLSFRQNLIPFEAPEGLGPPGRRQLYQSCPADLADVHRWSGREPY